MQLKQFFELKPYFENENTLIQTGRFGERTFMLKRYKHSANDAFRNEKILKEKQIYNRLFPKEPALVIEDGGQHVLAKPFIEGAPLSQWMKGWRFELPVFLKIALELARCLEQIHQNNVIHLDLNPSNIIYNPANGRVEITDFGSSSFLRLRSNYLGNPERVECNLHYISPEQTGRINRVVDYTTDFYSLGAVLYELATGRPPFSSDDPLELVHAHIAKEPASPSLWNPSLPPVLEAIILKLLSKNAADRYQSGEGLIRDLEECLDQWSRQGSILDFRPGARDISDRFRLSQKYYGREKEIDTLERAIEACRSGSREFVLIRGEAGVGKSNLVAETHKKLTQTRGLFLEGKFDQVNRNSPYYAWIEAFDDFIELLLTESDERLAYWRERLQRFLGNNISYLIELAPNLEWILPGFKREQILFNTETQNRFKFAIRSFIQCLSSAEHPLVIFIDDWQWADPASVELLYLILADPNIQYLLALVAFRDNEIDESHPLPGAIRRLAEQKLEPFAALDIRNLEKSDTASLLRDTLNAPEAELRSLNELIYDRTAGNALYYVQFLNALADEQLLRFDRAARRWRWDVQEIRRSLISENIIDLLIARIRRFEDHQQQLLQQAACIGSRFDLKTLAIISGKKEKEVEEGLYRALLEGLIYPDFNLEMAQVDSSLLGREYKFSHDRIQQGVYALIGEEEKEKIHYAIGQVLLKNLSDEEREKNIFSLANHLHKGRAKADRPEEKAAIAEINLQAAQKATSLFGLENAFNYLENGLAILGQNALEEYYEQAMPLHLRRYELGYFLSTDDETLAGWESLILRYQHRELDLANFQKLKVKGLNARGQYKDAVAVGLRALRELNYSIRENPSQFDLILSFIKTSRSYKKDRIQDLIQLPAIENPLLLTISEILVTVNAASYFSNQQLWALLTSETTRFFLRHGFTPLAPTTLASYGSMLIVASRDFNSGIAFGKLAVAVCEKLQASAYLHRALFIVNTLIRWWELPLEEIGESLEQTIQLSQTNGDPQYVAFAQSIQSSHDTFLSENLFSLKEKMNRNYRRIQETQDQGNIYLVRIYNQFLASLNSETHDSTRPDGEIYRYEEAKEVHQANNQMLATSVYLIASGRFRFFMNDMAGACADFEAEKAAGGSPTGTFAFFAAQHFAALAQGNCWDSMPEEKRKRNRSELAKMLRDFRRYARQAPSNFEAKTMLLEGMWNQIQGKNSQAADFYLQAVESAHRFRLLQDEAIAWEQAGRLAMRQEKTEWAKSCFSQAYEVYHRWGALAVCRRLMKENPWLEEKQKKQAKSASGRSSSDSSLAMLDLATVLKSSEALSSVIDREKLLRTLMLIAVENAGAQRGYLLLRGKEGLQVSAYGDVDKHTEVYQQLPFETFTGISKKVVQYVNRKGQPLILDHAAADPGFQDDPYLQQHQVRSVFSLPILNQGEFLGLLYLENNLTTSAFSSERVELLKLLSGQIAISLENARLVENLEEKVRERTQEIEKAREVSENLLLNILPRATAEELKRTGKAEPRFYPSVTVMFVDFKDFSLASRQKNYRELVDQIHYYFQAFDEIVAELGIEKIKTIGDAYMCAAGLPEERADHAAAMARAALRIRDFLEQQKQLAGKDAPFSYFDARIGMHSGPVVAGVVGSKKFAYDIWGDTVNVAARMESSSETGSITLSEATYLLIRDQFECRSRGTVMAKNIGEMEGYVLLGERR